MVLDRDLVIDYGYRCLSSRLGIADGFKRIFRRSVTLKV